MGWILVLDRGKRVALDRPLLVGASPSCDVVLAGLAKQHARFEANPDGATVRAEGGNEILVNDVRVGAGETRALLLGDVVRLPGITGAIEEEDASVPVRTAELALAALDRARPSPRIVVVSGPARGARFDLTEEGRAVRVGRAEECDWVVADPKLSRAHARLVLRGGAVLIRDLGSSRGTLLGDARLEPQKDMPWDPRRSVRIGGTVLTLQMPLALEQAVAEVLGKQAAEPTREEPADVLPAPAVTIPHAAPTGAGPLAAGPVLDAAAVKSKRSITPFVFAFVAALIVACLVVLLWIFGAFDAR